MSTNMLTGKNKHAVEQMCNNKYKGLNTDKSQIKRCDTIHSDLLSLVKSNKTNRGKIMVVDD